MTGWRPRPSIRLRIALVVTVVMFLALGTIGTLVDRYTSRALDRAGNAALQARLADTESVVVGVSTADAVRKLEFRDRDETFVQVVDDRGGVLTDSGELDGDPILTPKAVAAVGRRTVRAKEVLEPGDPPVRLLMHRARLADGSTAVVIVGASTAADVATLFVLRRGLLLGGAATTFLTAVIGFMAVALALRPVERIRRQAAAVDAREPQRRLEVPGTDDELARLAQTLNSMLERLDRGIQRERRLTADASHELRTPLALLKMELEVAMSEAAVAPRSLEQAQERIAQLTDTIRSSEGEVDRLVQLAESLLLLAQADQHELGLVRSRTNVRALLEGVASRSAARALREERAVTVVGPDADVDVDPIRLAQALGNLVDNAIRHGRGAVTIEAGFVDVDGREAAPDGPDATDLELAVLDEGPGFGAAFAASAFERFAREDAARTSAGAGLGLAIVQAIAAAHGGSASIVASGAGGGGVRIRIPYVAAQPAAAP